MSFSRKENPHRRLEVKIVSKLPLTIEMISLIDPDFLKFLGLDIYNIGSKEYEDYIKDVYKDLSQKKIHTELNNELSDNSWIIQKILVDRSPWTLIHGFPSAVPVGIYYNEDTQIGVGTVHDINKDYAIADFYYENNTSDGYYHQDYLGGNYFVLVNNERKTL